MKKKKLYRNEYSDVYPPYSDGTSAAYHRPRRNYWGNLYDDETIEGDENPYINEYGSDSLFDEEDDHDCYYESDDYD